MTQTLKTYTAYKDSGVNYINKIPKNWKVTRNKYLTEIKGRIGFKGYTKNDFVDKDSGALVIGASEMNQQGHIIISKPQYISWFKYYESPEIMLKKGQILIVQRGSTVGKVSFIDKDLGKATINPSLVVLKEIELNPKYYLYYLMSTTLQSYIKAETSTTAIPMITQSQIGNYFILTPPKKEQTQIAAYLDHKTTAIDKKITLLQQKITQYKAYRKSIINEVVTGKRLVQDGATIPIAKKNTKDSGISWIGKIPKHWEVKRFKNLCYKNHTGGTPSTSKSEMFFGTNTWITIADIKKSKFVDHSKLKLTDEAIITYNIPITPKGSLLYSFKLTLGKIAFAKKDIYTNEAIISIMPNKKIILEYYYYLLPIFLLNNATENIYGAKMLNQKLIRNTLLLNPPKKEQQQIATYLDTNTTIIDKIINNIETQISTLQELRKTLINDVVTGKVSVLHTQEANAAGKSYEKEAEIERKLNTLRRN